MRKITLSIFLALMPAVVLADYFWDVEHLAASVNGDSISLMGGSQLYATAKKSYLTDLVDIRQRIAREAGVFPKFLISSKNENNAFATWSNGQAIMVFTIPMLKACGNDFDAIAAIMGHEVAHLKLQHGTSSAVADFLLQVLASIAMGAIDAKLGGNYSAVFAKELVSLGQELTSKAYSRSAESEADEYGVRYMIKAGFDPAGAIRVHKNIIPSASSFFSTHPSSEDRLHRIYATISKIEQDASKGVQLARKDSPNDIPWEFQSESQPIPNQVGIVLASKERHGYVIFSGTRQDPLAIGDKVEIIRNNGKPVRGTVERVVEGYYSATLDNASGLALGDRVLLVRSQ